jgi:hypothetical protein
MMGHYHAPPALSLEHSMAAPLADYLISQGSSS